MEGEIFHLINRGVEKRKIFSKDEDRWRFLNNLSDFNRKDPVSISYYHRRKGLLAMRKPTDKLVDILCVCLMPNHYHLLVQEIADGGSSVFSKRIASGYTQYFNLRNERSGVLFQGRSKIIPIRQEEHFIHIPYYIFSNPLKLIEPGWKERGLKDYDKAMDFLENYKWSNFSGITGNSNFMIETNKKLFFENFDTSDKKFKKDFSGWLLAMRKPTDKK